jgi:hypothetical protein
MNEDGSGQRVAKNLTVLDYVKRILHITLNAICTRLLNLQEVASNSVSHKVVKWK